MKRSTGLTIVIVLALVQAVLAILRSVHWIQVGSELGGHGVLLLPILGMVAYARGALVAVIAVLYALFAWGAFGNRGWARAVGLTAAVVNVLIVLGILMGGEPAGRAIVWAVVPLIVIGYLLAPAGRAAFS